MSSPQQQWCSTAHVQLDRRPNARTTASAAVAGSVWQATPLHGHILTAALASCAYSVRVHRILFYLEQCYTVMSSSGARWHGTTSSAKRFNYVCSYLCNVGNTVLFIAALLLAAAARCPTSNHLFQQINKTQRHSTMCPVELSSCYTDRVGLCV